MNEHRKYAAFRGRILFVGFGSIGQGSLPLLLRHCEIDPGQITIVTAEESGRDIAERYGVRFLVEPVTRDNHERIYGQHLSRGDFLVNASVDVGCIDSIDWCQRHGVLYIDACIEPWAGGHTDTSVHPSRRTNYAYREAALALRGRHPGDTTCVLMHGANPGLVSHFVKQALLDIAADAGVPAAEPAQRAGWARLAMQLGVKLIQISERDHQLSETRRKLEGEFTNTWSSDAFCGEALQPAELGWGTHERNWPHDGVRFDFGCGSSIYLDRPGAATRVWSWAPQAGPFHGHLISHGEAHSIPDFLTVREGERVLYRPTCYYAYHPCDDAVSSLQEFAERGWRIQPRRRLLRDELTRGVDELGVLLAGHARGAYWYGSQLSIDEARALVPYNNATSVQVNVGYVMAILWAMRNPTRGIVEPDDIPFREVLEPSRPYLGRIAAVYTDWTPLEGRGLLYAEELDRSDPWQFRNFRISG
jgi:homospermidine synthase